MERHLSVRDHSYVEDFCCEISVCNAITEFLIDTETVIKSYHSLLRVVNCTEMCLDKSFGRQER